MSIRKAALVKCIYQFILFSIIGLALMFTLFHAAILALPVIAFMWTFWGFNFLTLITGVQFSNRYKISFALLNFFVIALLITFLIISSDPEEYEKVYTIAIITSICIGILYLLTIILFVKAYWKAAKIELLKLLGKEIPLEKYSELCKTKYPVLLVHGTGFRDRAFCNYWGGIPGLLEKHGASIFYSKHDAWANIEDAASQIADTLKTVLKETECEKVNIIAHSKGGIDVRYAISKLGLEDKIASVTMISSPNHGSKTLDKLFSIFGEWLFKFLAVFVNLWFKILGDKKPDFFRATKQFCSSYMEGFNKEITDSPSILYQSFAGKMKNPLSDIFMWFMNFVMKFCDGENDGLVSVESAKWADFRGVIEAQKFFGISHAHEVDAYRTNPKIKEADGLPKNSKTIRDFYINLIAELKEKGF
jgi:triacylglycerol lipase